MNAYFIKRVYRGLFRHVEWNIGIVHAPIGTFLEANPRPLVSWLPPAKGGKFLADPFALVKDGIVHILCEEFDYHTFRGRIVSIELTDWQHPSTPKVAIELPVSVSYPYLVEHQGDIYCIPETGQAGEIGLYKAREFPHKWVKSGSLIRNFAGVDATVFQYEGRWWLTCTSDYPQPDQQLFVWHARDLLGPWRSHSGNPVKTDIRSSRPAGTPFVHAGCLYRPAQDCSRTYGGRIVLNRVTTLTPAQFEEQPAAMIEPYANGPYPDGIHTVSAIKNVTVIDGMRRRFVPSALQHNVRKVLKHGL